MSDYDLSIHTNPDARAWAKFFIETYDKASDKPGFISEDNMIGWFANAMMAMHDHMGLSNHQTGPSSADPVMVPTSQAEGAV